MIICPSCGEENIEGADFCQQCQESLGFDAKPAPSSDLERSIWKDRIFKLAPRRPVVVEPETPVHEVLDLLVGHSIGCVIVVRDEEILGVFSERDALKRLNTNFAALGDRPISEFMTPSPETVDEDARIAFALHEMDMGGYRHLPVVRDGRVRGVISIRDILDYITANLLSAAD